MERRGFIKGMLTAIAGTTATVALAQPGEAAALITQRNLLLAQPKALSEDMMNRAIDVLQSHTFEVYGKLNDEYVPIGYIQSVQIDAQIDSFITYSGTITGTNPRYIQGLKEIIIQFGGPLPFRY